MSLRSTAARTAAIISLLVVPSFAFAQSGPWAASSAKLKGEALVRDADGGDLAEMRLIVQGGGDVNWQITPTNLSPLMAAASAGRLDVVKFLIEQGADPSLTDSNGRTALDRARLAGANDVVRFLTNLPPKGPRIAPPNPTPVPVPEAKPIKPAPVNPKPAPVNPKPAPVNPRPAPAPAPGNAWPAFGSLRIGDTVLYSVPGGWRRGVIRELGSPTAVRDGLTCSEKKYLVASLTIANDQDCFDYGRVVPVQRQAFWTTFFVGDWAVREIMAVNNRVIAGDPWIEFAGMGASEALRVNGDGTYIWKDARGVVAQGSWTAAADGPGIVLNSGPKKLAWTLTNETSALTENIRGAEYARLTAPGQMSITAKRPVAKR